MDLDLRQNWCLPNPSIRHLAQLHGTGQQMCDLKIEFCSRAHFYISTFHHWAEAWF